MKQLDNQLRKHLAVYDLHSMQDIKIHITFRFAFLIKHSMMSVTLFALLVNKTLLLFWCHSSLIKTSLFIIRGKGTTRFQQAKVCHFAYLCDTGFISSAKQMKKENQ